jgi:cytochrome c oxidase assembly factor CtaG
MIVIQLLLAIKTDDWLSESVALLVAVQCAVKLRTMRIVRMHMAAESTYVRALRE